MRALKESTITFAVAFLVFVESSASPNSTGTVKGGPWLVTPTSPVGDIYISSPGQAIMISSLSWVTLSRPYFRILRSKFRDMSRSNSHSILSIKLTFLFKNFDLIKGFDRVR